MGVISLALLKAQVVLGQRLFYLSRFAETNLITASARNKHAVCCEYAGLKSFRLKNPAMQVVSNRALAAPDKTTPVLSNRK
jgi:hypothetical protein